MKRTAMNAPRRPCDRASRTFLTLLIAIVGASGVLWGASLAWAPSARAANGNTTEDTFARPDQTGWGVSVNHDGNPNYEWGGAADGSKANITLTGNVGVVAYDATNRYLTSTLSNGTTSAGGDALVELRMADTWSAEAGPILNYSSANGGSYYEADLESEYHRLQFSVLKNGVFSYPGKTYPITITPNVFYWIRLHVSGTSPKTVQARVWPHGTPEPSGWQIEFTDSSPLGNGVAGVHTAFQYASIGHKIGFAAFSYSASGAAIAPQADSTFVGTLAPSSGQYGDAVTITGTGLSGATAVTFNGINALDYTINSDASITARVPNAGAQTGAVAVTTPNGTAASGSAFSITSASGPVYWVALGGSDTNPGTYSQPFATIAHADSIATAGARIHVLPGDYSQAGTLTTHASGTASTPIVYISDVQYGALINMTGPSADRAWEIDGSYEQVIGFDVTTTGSAGRIGIIAYGVHDLIARNQVHGVARSSCTENGGAGITVVGNNGYASHPASTVDSNLVWDIGPFDQPCQYADSIHGIYVSTSDNSVTNNIVYHVTGYGIHLYHNPNGNVVANNDVDHATVSGIVVGAADGYTAANNTVFNNILRDNGAFGFEEWKESGGTMGANAYRDNDTYNNAQGPYKLRYPDDGSTVTRNLAIDPRYTQYTSHGGDYHLVSGSGCVNVSGSSGAPDHDFDQAMRPRGSTAEIGAYEFY